MLFYIKLNVSAWPFLLRHASAIVSARRLSPELASHVACAHFVSVKHNVGSTLILHRTGEQREPPCIGVMRRGYIAQGVAAACAFGRVKLLGQFGEAAPRKSAHVVLMSVIAVAWPVHCVALTRRPGAPAM